MRLPTTIRALLCLVLVAHGMVAAAQQGAPASRPAHPFGRPLVPDLVADPSIAEFNGTFYLFATTDGAGADLASAGKPVVWQSKDSLHWHFFTDDDGAVYMVWAQRGIARLKPDFSAIDGEAVTVPTKRPGYSEGPLLFKRRGVYYYLYTLDGHENYRYAYMMSRISAMGPWEAPEQDLVAVSDPQAGVYGPGHGCVFNPQGTDDWYLVYLEFGRGGTTRQVYADRLQFNPDGTIRPVKVTMLGVGALRDVGPRKPNLAAHATASASSTRQPSRVEPRVLSSLDRTETFEPGFAIDGSNGSRWMAVPGDAAPTLMLDLGRATRLERAELHFVMPTGGHAYQLEHSLDGRDWKLMGAATTPSARSPHVVESPVVARYLRTTITAGVPGIWEFNAY